MVSIRLGHIKTHTPATRVLLVGGLLILLLAAIRLEAGYLANRRYFKTINNGITALHQQRLADAEHAWLQALIQNPLRPEAYQLLSHLYLQTGHPEQAIPLLSHLYALAPTTPHVLCYLAEAYALTGQEAKLLETARKAVKVEPDCPRAHALLGIAYGNQQDHKEAISELSRAAALAPNDVKIATSLAQAQLDDADLDGAANTIRGVITRNPNYPTAYYVLGWDYARRDPTPSNLQTAIQAFEKLQQLDPSRTDAREELGRLYLLSGNNQKAIAVLHKAWLQGDRSAECAYNLATAYRNIGDRLKASAMLQQYQRISSLTARYNTLLKRAVARPNDIATAIALAQAEVEIGNHEGAVKIMNSVLQTAPTNPIALKAAVEIYKSAGALATAHFYQERLHALTSGDSHK